MADFITCPKCGEKIPLTEAIAHQIDEQFKAELADQLREREQEHAAALAAREVELRAEFNSAGKERDAELEKRAQERVAAQIDELTTRSEEQSEELQEARKRELAFRNERRKLKEQREAMDLEIARRIDEERDRIAAQATERLNEQHRFKLREKELTLEQMTKRIEELQSASQQTRAGLLGEVLERDIEDLLRERFPSDQITPVKSGVRGADVLQVVRSPRGHDCGTILWESKRTKNWSNNWIAKLKQDKSAAKSDIAVIVSSVLPEDARYIEWRDGVWLVDTVCCVALATALRSGLIEMSQARNIDSHKNEALDVLYEYLCGKDFRQRVTTAVEAFIEMKSDLETERRSLERAWSKRSKQLDRLALNTAGMYGDLQGILGNALSPVEQLELPPAD